MVQHNSGRQWLKLVQMTVDTHTDTYVHICGKCVTGRMQVSKAVNDDPPKKINMQSTDDYNFVTKSLVDIENELLFFYIFTTAKMK